MARCAGTRADGQACRAMAMAHSEHCFWHDPEKRIEMIEASRRGGSRKTLELLEHDELTAVRAMRIIAGTVAAVANGSLDAGTARTIGYLLQVEARIRERRDLEERIAALEEASRMSEST